MNCSPCRWIILAIRKHSMMSVPMPKRFTQQPPEGNDERPSMHDETSTKHEIRNPKQMRMTEGQNDQLGALLVVLDFVLRACFGFRASNFVLPSSFELRPSSFKTPRRAAPARSAGP